jgi:hypothetical protein
MKAPSVFRPALTALEPLFEQGSRCIESGDYARAIACYRTVLSLAPDLSEAHVNLGVACEKSGALQEAESCYRRALALNSDLLDGYLNLGALLVNQKRFVEARSLYETAIKCFPRSPAIWSNLAVLLTCADDHEGAERCFREALRLDETYALARYNLSYLLLRRECFEEGWQALEARPWSLALSASIPAPRWQGESLEGKALLIGCEAGIGDMIQFIRYVAVLKQQGAARIGIICPPSLKRIFGTLSGVAVVVALGEPVPELGWDFWTLPLSLPFHCGTRHDSIPARIPYLHPNPEQVLAWHARLPVGGVKVGLAWKGNPQFENDADRSLPSLATLAPLATAEGIHFTSLQKGVAEGEAEHPPAGMTLFNPSPGIQDFADTAALVANLDLVISVDTAVAHLAGALGKPCWVLLPNYKTDWRWFTDRTDSPWYPGAMRLFHQEEAGDWNPVIKAVSLALESFAREAGLKTRT